MPQTVEAFYHDGIVEVKRKPSGIRKAKALVIFLDAEKAPKRHTVDDGFREALNSDMRDFEDAVQYVNCMRNGCDVLATRNKADFVNRPNVLDPAELIERIKATNTI